MILKAHTHTHTYKREREGQQTERYHHQRGMWITWILLTLSHYLSQSAIALESP